MMSKKTINKKEKLSSALKANIKLRKTQISNRDEKNIKGKTLEANVMNSVSAISYQILNGKNGMPAFGGRLKESEIQEIAKYVLIQSANNFEN